MRRYTVPASAILDDAQATLEALASRYRLVAVCHPREPQEVALRRDGLLRYFVATIGPEGRHPPPQMWTDTLAELGVEPSRAVHVGNRLDNDVVPAKAAGLKTVWLLRGEAPPAPTYDQLGMPDAVITTFAGVTEALVTITEQRTGTR
jgi:putative hydrolase of the HAD superfamily